MGFSPFRNTLVRIRNNHRTAEAPGAGGQVWEDNSLWVASGLPPPTSLSLHPGRRVLFPRSFRAAGSQAHGHTSKHTCFCSRLLPTSCVGEITLCSGPFHDFGQTRSLNHDHSQGRIVAPPLNLNTYLDFKVGFLMSAFGGVTGSGTKCRNYSSC